MKKILTSFAVAFLVLNIITIVTYAEQGGGGGGIDCSDQVLIIGDNLPGTSCEIYDHTMREDYTYTVIEECSEWSCVSSTGNCYCFTLGDD